MAYFAMTNRQTKAETWPLYWPSRYDKTNVVVGADSFIFHSVHL